MGLYLFPTKKGEKWPKKWFPPPLFQGTQVEAKPKTFTQYFPSHQVTNELLSSLEEMRNQIFQHRILTCTTQVKNSNIGQTLGVITKVPSPTKGLASSPIQGTIEGLYKFSYDTLSRTWVPRSKGPSNEDVQMIAKHDGCSLQRPKKSTK